MSAHSDTALVRLANGVLWPGFLGTSAPDWLKRAIDEGLAGAVYFGQNIDPGDATQPARLSRELRGIRSDVLIGIDEEGGNVTRLESANGSSLPSPAQLGRFDSTELTRATGAEIGARMLHAGADVALSVVADVNTNAQNPVIGVRAFGDNAALVGRHVAALVEGVQSTGVTACIKHFPGHGDTITDSHYELPRLGLSWREIERDHLPPFRAAIEAGARAVMTAHIVVPELGEEPATLNPRILAVLREQGFAGVIVTDAMDMAAVRSRYGAGPGAVRALAAGVDLLCVGNPGPYGPKGGTTSDLDDYLEMRTAILDAVDDRSLSVEALERANRHVAELRVTGPFAGPNDGEPLSSPMREQIRSDATPPGLAPSLCRVTGNFEPFAAAVTLFDLRASASIAVAAESNFFARRLAEQFELSTVELGPLLYATRASEAAASVHTGADSAAILEHTDAVRRRAVLERAFSHRGHGHGHSHRVVVVVDAIASAGPQLHDVEVIADLCPEAVVLNAGLPAPRSLSLPLIDCLGASALTADGALALLVSGEEQLE